jgi:hypothetical protein
MRQDIKQRLERLEAKLNPAPLQKCYIHFEHEPIPDDYNPECDKLIRFVEEDCRVYPNARYILKTTASPGR